MCDGPTGASAGSASTTGDLATDGAAPPTVSVIVCTLNRARHLDRCLGSLQAQTAPPDSFEVVVVDNGSTDDTPAVVDRARMERPNVRYVLEPVLGLSHARNRGMAEARGEVLAFIDDDAEAEPEWVEALWSAYETSPETAAVGGKIIPVWPGERPSWLPDALNGSLTILDLGDERLELESRNPYGANMSVRRSVVSRVGPFDVELGRVGRGLLSMEERDFFDRIREVGGRVVYEPRAVVHHHIEPERVSARWLIRRTYAQGRSRARLTTRRRRRSRVEWLMIASVYALRVLGRAASSPLVVVRALVRSRSARAELLCHAAGTAQRLGYGREVARVGVLSARTDLDGVPPAPKAAEGI